MGYLHRILHTSEGAGSTLEKGLERINERLGLQPTDTTRNESIREAAKSIRVMATEHVPRSIYYAPDMDGQAEAGEVVWIWAPSDASSKQPHERAILVVGRDRHTVFGLLISPNPQHEDEDSWINIGSGEWDLAGRQSWVRIDRVLRVAEDDIRRQGALFPERRFEVIASKLRSDYHWS